MGAAAAAITLWAAPMAQAHAMTWGWDAGCGFFGNARCGYSTISADHRTAGACDTYADGIGFATEYVLSNGVDAKVLDPNGSSSGCGYYTAPSGVYIQKFRPCQHYSDGSYICLIGWEDVT
ncbi:hypothetical protein ABZ468_07585 [Streptomyces sp. NPDC005708]|uniref:hypothetical protein n=1 Tax=Streptomyces sp. NPDC005708 TaxID=3154564 RepID=UPI0033C82C82